MRLRDTMPRRTAALALTAGLAFSAAACGDDVVDDGVEEEVDEEVDDAADAEDDGY